MVCCKRILKRAQSLKKIVTATEKPGTVIPLCCFTVVVVIFVRISLESVE